MRDEQAGPSTAGRRSAHAAAETKALVVDAALVEFARHGVDAVGLRDVAAAAGISHGLLRHHFGSKEGLWRAVVDEAHSRFVAALPEPAAGPEPATGRGEPGAPSAAGLVRDLALAAARHPQIIRLLLLEGAVPGERLEIVLARAGRLRDLSGDVLDRLHAQGRLHEYDRASFFLLLLGSVALPFAVPGLSERVWRVERLDESLARRHAERVVALLGLGDEGDSPGDSPGLGHEPPGAPQVDEAD